jgi:hypothetical protein
MFIHVRVRPPISNLLGLSNAGVPTELDLAIKDGASLKDLFDRITLEHQEFKILTDPGNNKLGDILIVLDGDVVLGTELDQISLHDQSIVTLLGRYKGG